MTKKPSLVNILLNVITAFTVATFPASAYASESLLKKVERILKDHELMRMVTADVETAKAQIGAERSAYYPKLTVNAGKGTQSLERDTGTSGDFKPREVVIGVNQLITDFGLTSNRVKAAETIADKEKLEADLQRQNLLLAAIEAQMQVIQADRVLKYAIQSENNIKRQASLESIRVESGKGYASDVLQAKAQLSGAQARRVLAENRLNETLNRYKSIFKESISDASKLEGLNTPSSLLPESLEHLNEIVTQSSPDIVAAEARADVSHAERNVAISKELAPRLDLQISQGDYEDYDGSIGKRSDTKAMVRLGWSFELGMKSRYVWRSADQAALSSEEKANYVRVQALEEGQNAWANWQTAKKRHELLKDQVEIAARFVELARKERELGRRSLIDILNGEITLINAQSDATAARIDEVIASYRLLRSVGRLDPEVLAKPGSLVPANEFFPPTELLASAKIIPIEVPTIKKLSDKAKTSKR